MRIILITLIVVCCFVSSCRKEPVGPTGILGYQLLSELSGHWIGSNETAYGPFDWFAFDFRPISESHVHSIYEGGTNSNIINSVFVADFEGEKKIMARNGGWLGTIYRATYFVLDQAEIRNNSSYYRLVDAVGGVKRSYIEFEFKNDKLFFNAYKDDSGTLDDPVIHMAFEGQNENPDYASEATTLFNFPQDVTEVDLNNKFVDLIDPDSALFLDEELDPFPKAAHGHLSDLNIDIERGMEAVDARMLLYISTVPLINEQGMVDLANVDKHVVRTIDIFPMENDYMATYLHPDDYYITIFADKDGNMFPSSGDVCNASVLIEVEPEMVLSTGVTVDLIIQ